MWVLCRRNQNAFHPEREIALLVTEEGGSHATDDDVDSHTDRDQETRCDRAHSRQVGDSGRSTQDKHGGDDDVGGQSKENISVGNLTGQCS